MQAYSTCMHNIMSRQEYIVHLHSATVLYTLKLLPRHPAHDFHAVRLQFLCSRQICLDSLRTKSRRGYKKENAFERLMLKMTRNFTKRLRSKAG
jgi:hypothetical protein